MNSGINPDVDEALDPWVTTLDGFEQRLRDVRDAVAAGSTSEVPAFSPPSDLGLLPAPLVERAQALLDSSRDLHRFVEQAQTAVAGRLAAPPETRAPQRASRLDVSV